MRAARPYEFDARNANFRRRVAAIAARAVEAGRKYDSSELGVIRQVAVTTLKIWQCAALRSAFPADLDAVAIETDNDLHYTWRDLERATAMMANMLASLDLPVGARIAVQVEKSVEAAMLYLATLRAGYVFLPLNTAYQSAEIEYFIGNAEPAVVVCSQRNFGWVGCG